MTDYGSYQFKVGVGHGGSTNVRVRKDPTDLFPDGMVGAFVRRDGRLCVELLNRSSGKKWQRHTTHPDIWQTTISSGENRLQNNVAPFASVYPSKVEKITGGLLLTLPEVMAPPHLRGQYRPKPLEPAVPDNSEVEKEAVTLNAAPPPEIQPLPARMEALPVYVREQAIPAVSSPKPQISLEAAVAAVNAWKDIMGDSLRIEQGTGGKLRVTAQYG